MTLTTVPALTGTTRVDGIDVDHLLREIGDASAMRSAIDLFGLLMSAQRVLVQMHDGAMTSAEAQLLASYRANAENARYMTIEAAAATARVSPRQRPALTLVPAGRQPKGAR